MPINFIPNDPLTQNVLPIRQQPPRPERQVGQARFRYTPSTPYAEDLYAVGTDGFLFWQCREAALAAVETWERLDGPLQAWDDDEPRLVLQHNAGPQARPIAAFGGIMLYFFRHETGNKTLYLGSSADVVVHEIGHALLQTIKPDLHGGANLEVDAFHEAFGDCLSLLTALADQKTRQTVLPDVAAASNVAVRIGEAVADHVQQWLPELPQNQQDIWTHATKPRRLLNTFKWKLPSQLPDSGGPDDLINNKHSFSQVFSGCFYRTLLNIFNALPGQDEAALWTAAETAGRLLISAVRDVRVVPRPRFFKEVGRMMMEKDTALNAGANHQAIREAFASHNVVLDGPGILDAAEALVGAAPNFAAPQPHRMLARATRDELRARFAVAPRRRMGFKNLNIGDRQVAQVVHRREIPLDELDDRLRGVVAIAHEPVFVGGEGSQAVVLGEMPREEVTREEVLTFVKALLRSGDIKFGKDDTTAQLPTHTIRKSKGKRVLTRVRFT